MPDFLRHIERYNGNTVKDKVWLDQLQSAQTLHQLLDSYILETAPTRLVGGTRVWYETKAGEIHIWNDFVSKFRTTFVQTKSLPIRWKRMENKRQSGAEEIDTYYHE